MKFTDIPLPHRLKLLLIAAPLALACIYYPFFAADRYVSESEIGVRQSNTGSAASGLLLAIPGLSAPSQNDPLYVKEYIHSLGLLNKLDARLHLRQHYQSQKTDPFFRLWGGTSQEWFLDYYRSRVKVTFQDQAALLTIEVEGFDPAFAQELNKAILEESERFVNDFSQRISGEQMKFSEGELKRAQERLQEAQQKMLAFQREHHWLDPMAQAQAAGALTADLQATLTKQEAELRSARSYLTEDSYQVQALRKQVEAMRGQLEAERTRSIASENDKALNALAAEFQDLKIALGFAEDTYKLALTAVESSRIDSIRKVKSLVVIEPPSLPEIALYPRIIYNLITLLVVCSLLYGIVRLVLATIREHQD
ncbi:MAG: hypothetical protein FWG56_01540 [Desulfovibrionaceae bacterium]|jgi:capsular polysaccharide transport system permease protein|nr:hypothetical protein [Desulfovibrionaceae bacterium]